MERIDDNPYAWPTDTEKRPASAPIENDGLPLWRWLAFVTLNSVLMRPPDLLSSYIILLIAIVSFGGGTLFGSPLRLAARLLQLLLAIAAAVALSLAFFADHRIFTTILILTSIGMGAWASRSIPLGRARIVGAFCAGYVVGSVFLILGAAIGAVVATLIAQRSLEKQIVTDVEIVEP